MKQQEKDFSVDKANILKTRRWRLGAFVLASVLLSAVISYLSQVPINLVGGYLGGTLLILCLWQPLFGVPYFGLGAWWIMDRRLPLILLLLPYVVVLVFFLVSPGNPHGMSDEDREAIKDAMGEDFFEETDQP